MSKFKVGQLVMLISRGNAIENNIPVEGAFGTVLSSVQTTIERINPSSLVYFPKYPSLHISMGWNVWDSVLILINDPDADTIEETEKNLDKELVK